MRQTKAVIRPSGENILDPKYLLCLSRLLIFVGDRYKLPGAYLVAQHRPMKRTFNRLRPFPWVSELASIKTFIVTHSIFE